MMAAQVNLNTVLPSANAKAKAQTGSTDASFSDILNKENNSAMTKANARESKVSNAFEKNSKEGGNIQTANADNKAVNNANNRTTDDKGGALYNVKDSTCQADKESVKQIFTKELKDDGKEQCEGIGALMAILASLIADISNKTGADETVIKDFMIGADLTSDNLLDIDSWKGFVTKMNGLDNISAILTNNEAFKDLEGISEVLNSYLYDMEQMTAGMTEGVADENQATRELIESEKKESVSLSEILAKMFEKSETAELVTIREETETDKVIEEDTQEPAVMIPLAGDVNGANSQEPMFEFDGNDKNSSGDKRNISAGAVEVSAQKLFENIAASVKELEGTESLPEGTTAKAVLEQVTNQIKNLHAPDKTSLEFLLTPETLGKVAVNVSAKHGIMQAEFRVETAEAKAALESQIATLKLNFENQGLKVESVSVMISENGIGRENQGKSAGEEGKKNKRNRNFAIDGEDGIEMVSVSPEEAIRAYTEDGTGSNINLGA